MILDPFMVAAGAVATPAYIKQMCLQEPILFVDGERFLSYVERSYSAVDVMTYSISKSTFPVLSKVRRLIFGLRQLGTTVKAKEKQYVMNNHMKVFLCFKGASLADTYVGSLNLTRGSNLNLMYRVLPQHGVFLLELFNSIWK